MNQHYLRHDVRTPMVTVEYLLSYSFIIITLFISKREKREILYSNQFYGRTVESINKSSEHTQGEGSTSVFITRVEIRSMFLDAKRFECQKELVTTSGGAQYGHVVCGWFCV